MIDAGRVRDATREVLGRPVYDDLDQTVVEEWLDRARGWAADLLDALLGTGAANGVGRLLALVVVALVVVGAAVLLLGLQRRGERETVVEVRAGLDAVTALGTADRAREVGHLEESIRLRYGALVLALVESGVVAGRPGLTVGEVDVAVGTGVPTAAAAVVAAGRVLADVAYGDRPATTAGDDIVAAGLDAVAAATGRGELRRSRTAAAVGRDGGTA